jgi:hypothetical protein
MIATVVVYPHEAHDAAEAYGDLLTPDQRQEMMDELDEGREVILRLDFSARTATVIAEG